MSDSRSWLTTTLPTVSLSLHGSLADDPGDDPVEWYYPLEGNIWKAQTLWDSTCSSESLSD